MRYKMLALILALTVVSWAQTATHTTPSTPQQSTVPADKAKCPCCNKTAAADAKDTPACCAHHDMTNDMKDKDGKEAPSCCAGKDAMASGGKDGMSCMTSNKDKTATSCCKEGCSKDSCDKDKTAAACCEKCGKEGEKGCCSSKKTDKAAKHCCAKELHS